MCNPYRTLKKNASSKGLSSLSYILFLVTFIAVIIYFGAQYAAAPTPALSQTRLQFNASSNGTYLETISSYNHILLKNVANVNVTSLTCSFGFVVIDGVIGCIYNYASAFLSLTTMTSDNTFMVILLGILILGLVWAFITLWGGS
jgi:hypothetical protein